MNTFLRAAIGALLLAVVSIGPLLPETAVAAQSYDNCTGYIDSLPATLTKQGTWCLRHDLATNITNGNAIVIGTSNVTIDCNDFKLGGTGAGVGTSAVGIYAVGRLNATVRHCNIRGFHYGIFFDQPSAGNVIEDNRFDGNTSIGVAIYGDNSVVRRNSVSDTGGSAFLEDAYGIVVSDAADVRDNTISGVAPAAGASSNAYGIHTSYNIGGSIDGNRVRGLAPSGAGAALGISSLYSAMLSIQDNVVIGDGTGRGLTCSGSDSRARGNMINNFATAIELCRDDGNSL